jgi:hypothetical protein
MVKRKLKQKTGDLTVIVNVGGAPTKKGRKKRGKSRARGGSVRPAKNFVVSYTDQTPTLNLLKEFSETNRLLLTGQNNLATDPRLSIAPMNRLIPTTVDPSIGPAQRLSMNLMNQPPLVQMNRSNIPKDAETKTRPPKDSTTESPMNRSSMNRLTPPTSPLPQTLDPMNRSTSVDPRSSFGKLLPKHSRSVSPPRAPTPALPPRPPMTAFPKTPPPNRSTQFINTESPPNIAQRPVVQRPPPPKTKEKETFKQKKARITLERAARESRQVEEAQAGDIDDDSFARQLAIRQSVIEQDNPFRQRLSNTRLFRNLNL